MNMSQIGALLGAIQVSVVAPILLLIVFHLAKVTKRHPALAYGLAALVAVATPWVRTAGSDVATTIAASALLAVIFWAGYRRVVRMNAEPQGIAG